MAAVAAVPVAAPAAPSGTPITSCTTGALQAAFASGGSYVLQCSGDISVPGAPFLVSKTVSVAAGPGAKVTLDGENKFTVIEVGAGGNLSLSHVTISHGKALGAGGGSAPAGGNGEDGSAGANGVAAASGTPGAPGDDGTDGVSGGLGGSGGPGKGGGMLISLGASATLTGVNFSGDVAQGGKGGSGGKGGGGGKGGRGGRGGPATTQSGSGGDGGSGGSGGQGGQGGNGGNGGDAQGGAIYNQGTLSVNGGNFSHDKAIAGSAGKGGAGGNGGKAGNGGAGGDDNGQAVDGSGGQGGNGGAGGGDGPGGFAGNAQGGAIYNAGTIATLSGVKFKGDSAKGGKGANAGKLGKGGAGGNGGTGADGNNPGGDDDQDAGGLGGIGGDGGQGGGGNGGSDAPGPGGNAQGGAIFTTSNFTAVNVTLSGNTAKGQPAGKGSPAAQGGQAGIGGGGNGGAAASGSDGGASPTGPGVASDGKGTDPNISPSSIKIVVNKQKKCVVPAVAKLSLAAAKGAITSAGCSVGTITNKPSSSVPKGNVISSQPGAGKNLKAGSPVNLKVSAGKNASKAKCVVPKVKNKGLSVAKKAITAANCAVGTITHKKSSTVAKQHVISSHPGAGGKHKAGTKVNLTVSKGK